MLALTAGTLAGYYHGRGVAIALWIVFGLCVLFLGADFVISRRRKRLGHEPSPDLTSSQRFDNQIRAEWKRQKKAQSEYPRAEFTPEEIDSQLRRATANARLLAQERVNEAERQDKIDSQLRVVLERAQNDGYRIRDGLPNPRAMSAGIYGKPASRNDVDSWETNVRHSLSDRPELVKVFQHQPSHTKQSGAMMGMSGAAADYLALRPRMEDRLHQLAQIIGGLPRPVDEPGPARDLATHLDHLYREGLALRDELAEVKPQRNAKGEAPLYPPPEVTDRVNEFSDRITDALRETHPSLISEYRNRADAYFQELRAHDDKANPDRSADALLRRLYAEPAWAVSASLEGLAAARRRVES